MVPALAGAVALRVKAAVPDGAPDTKPELKVTLQDKRAPAADGSEPQFTPLTPVPEATAVATTPAGKASEMRADVPDETGPEFPKPRL